MSTDGLNIGRCLRSGQAFRWSLTAARTWLGVDGDAWYLVREDADFLHVRSNCNAERFRRLFRLDWDAAAVEAEIGRLGPELSAYMLELRGLRLLRQEDPEEVFFSFLCSANNHIRRIAQMVSALASMGPMFAEVEGRPLHRFPDSATISAIGEDRLRSLGFGYRARTIPLAAARLADLGGRSWLDTLRVAPYTDVIAALTAMPGVGRKLADCVALFGLHRDDVIPIDTHIWQALTRLYFPHWSGCALTPHRYEEASHFFRERFGTLTGWAHQYLFYEDVLNWRTRQSHA